MLRLMYQWRCDACGECVEEVRGVPLFFGAMIPAPTIPEGWRRVDERVLCQAHTVEVIDKAMAGVR